MKYQGTITYIGERGQVISQKKVNLNAPSDDAAKQGLRNVAKEKAPGQAKRVKLELGK